MKFSRKVIRSNAKELFKDYWGFKFNEFWNRKEIIREIKKKIIKGENNDKRR